MVYCVRKGVDFLLWAFWKGSRSYVFHVYISKGRLTKPWPFVVRGSDFRWVMEIQGVLQLRFDIQMSKEISGPASWMVPDMRAFGKEMKKENVWIMMNMITTSKVEQLRDAVLSNPKVWCKLDRKSTLLGHSAEKMYPIVFVGVLLEISEHPFEMTCKHACFADQIFDVSGDGIA